MKKTSLIIVFMLLCITPVLAVEAKGQWCLVSESGNPVEPQSHMGSVPYEFEILKTEVTNGMYCEFLNAVASTCDRYNLYSPLMEDHFWGGIRCIKEINGNRYECKSGYENLPVVFVSWFDAARYTNWLHFGKPNYGISVLGTTEGNANVGAYNTLNFSNPVTATVSAAHRNLGATYWLPNRDEWLKAGFYGGKGKWWRYATQNDSLPVAKLGERNAANYYTGTWAIPYPHLAAVGMFACPSWCGTVDQAGNAAEWIETIVPNGQGWRLAVGGSLFRYANSLETGFYEGDSAEKKLSTFSFRVARKVDAKPVPVDGILKTIIEPVQTKEKTPLYVFIGNPNNPPDLFYGNFGTVAYPFEIGRCEISNQEWTDFLNAVAVNEDPYGLYNSNQGDGVLGGIDRFPLAAQKGWRYQVKDGWGNRPVNYIGWYDLARYANWLHYGCPNGRHCEVGTTEGTQAKGAYNTSDFEAIRKGEKKPYQNFGRRNVNALYWIPNQNEWYKAAYYDPTRTGPRPYWDFPNQSDNIPENPHASKNVNGVNYQKQDHLAEGPPFYLATVDSYQASASHYGTLQQGGNVWEWQEDWQYGQVGVRGLRGGSFGYTEIGLHAGNCDPGGLNEESYVFGGRLARRVQGINGFPELPLKQKIIFRMRTMGPREWLTISTSLAIIGGLFLSIIISAIVKIWRMRNLRRTEIP